MILGSTEPQFTVSRGGTYDMCVYMLHTMRMDPTLFPHPLAPPDLRCRPPSRHVCSCRCFFFIYLSITRVAEP